MAMAVNVLNSVSTWNLFDAVFRGQRVCQLLFLPGFRFLSTFVVISSCSPTLVGETGKSYYIIYM